MLGVFPHLFTQIQVDSHVSTLKLVHSHPTTSFLKGQDLMLLYLARHLFSRLKSRKPRRRPDSSHRFWRALSFQLYLLYPSLERVGSP